MIYQRTIETPIFCSGTAVRSGKTATLRLLPAPVDTGIKFVRTDLETNNEILIEPSAIKVGNGSAIIATNHGQASVTSIEDLMSSFWFLNITNIIVEINTEEVPAMDGSAEYFLFMIESAGITLQEKFIKSMEIAKEISVTEGDKSIIAMPNKGSLCVEFLIDFPGNYPMLSNERYMFDSGKNNFRYDIARARTFATTEQLEQAQTIDNTNAITPLNAIIIGKEGPVNSEPPRYVNEPARHKVLDFIGDLYLSGFHVSGRFECKKSGHHMNLQLLQKIFEDPENYSITTHS